jgi:hypothetical protein
MLAYPIKRQNKTFCAYLNVFHHFQPDCLFLSAVAKGTERNG